jgi:hypothetical protein
MEIRKNSPWMPLISPSFLSLKRPYPKRRSPPNLLCPLHRLNLRTPRPQQFLPSNWRPDALSFLLDLDLIVKRSDEFASEPVRVGGHDGSAGGGRGEDYDQGLVVRIETGDAFWAGKGVFAV